jgi:hypothetical protein
MDSTVLLEDSNDPSIGNPGISEAGKVVSSTAQDDGCIFKDATVDGSIGMIHLK